MKLKEYISRFTEYYQKLPPLKKGVVGGCSGIMLFSLGVIIYILFGYDPSSDKWLNKFLAIYTIIGGGGLTALLCFWEEFACKVHQHTVEETLKAIDLKEQIFVDAALEDKDLAKKILDSLGKEFKFVPPIDPKIPPIDPKKSGHAKTLEERYQYCKAVVICGKKVPDQKAWVSERLRMIDRIKIHRAQPLKIAVYTTKDNFIEPQPRIEVKNLDCDDKSSLKDWLKSLQNQPIN